MQTPATDITEHHPLMQELQELRWQLQEAHEAIEAVRKGQIDALIIEGEAGAELYSLRTADLSYRVFVEGMKEGAVTLSAEGIVLYANQQFAHLAGTGPHAVLGCNFLQFFSPPHKALVQALLLQSTLSPIRAETELGPPQQTVHVQLAMAPMQFDGQTLIGVLITDLTASYAAQKALLSKNEELARANAALEASNHDLQQFASVASHDLQEPLRKIQLFTSRLAEPLNQLAPANQRLVEKIGNSAARMKALVIDVLNYSRLSSAAMMQEGVMLNDIIEKLLEDFELRIAEVDAHIQVAALPAITANTGQMRQVFQNLLSNALKFIEAGRPVHIQITGYETNALMFDATPHLHGPYMAIAVQDNGIGFDSVYAQHIFSLFERLNSKDQYEGTGIGLAITKKIIEKHRGIIRAVSEPGKGTRFEMVLPKNPPLAADAPTPTPPLANA